MEIAKMSFACIIELYVTVNNMKISSDARKCLCCEFRSQAAINLLRWSCKLEDIFFSNSVKFRIS